MNQPAENRCARCREYLPTSAFRPNPSCKDRLHSWCRRCTSEAAEQWREQHPETVAGYNERKRRKYAEQIADAEAPFWRHVRDALALVSEDD
jgi:hypothetical protein